MRNARPALRDPISAIDAATVGDLARAALLAELDTWPKPGLVSRVDSGSHDDMHFETLRRSVDAIAPFFARLAAAGRHDAGMGVLRRIGVDAERAMMAATGGINTHRGAVFALGLLSAAAGGLGDRATPRAAAEAVRRRWGAAIASAPFAADSHGAMAARRHGAGGARAEAAAGFPTVLDVGLVALRQGRALAADDAEAARVHSFFVLLATVVDTNLLHRGGAEAIAFAHETAARFLDDGGIANPRWRRDAEAAHRAFVGRRLSPGGSADLLSATLFLDSLDRRVAGAAP